MNQEKWYNQGKINIFVGLKNKIYSQNLLTEDGGELFALGDLWIVTRAIISFYYYL